MSIDGSGMSAMGTADLVIAIAYFFIPAEIAMYLLRRRRMMHLDLRSWFIGALFISFILLCGFTHLFSVLNLPSVLILLTKWATAVVSVSTSVLLLRVIPEALSLPQYLQELTYENKLMKDFRGVMVAMRRDLREEAIIDNARHKLRRILPARTLIDISTDTTPPHFLHAPREVLTLPIVGGLSMHLRRTRVNEAQVMWLHDVCLQMKQALQQAAYLRNAFQPNMQQQQQQQQQQQHVRGPNGPLCLAHFSSSSSSSSSLYMAAKGGEGGGGRQGEGNNEICHPRRYLSTTSVHNVEPNSCMTSSEASSSLALCLPPSPQSATFKASFLTADTAATEGVVDPVPPVFFPQNSSGSSTALPVAAVGGEDISYPHFRHGQEQQHAHLLHHHHHQQQQQQQVERVLEVEFELARLRIKCAGILSRVLTLVDVVDTESLSPSQKKCVVLIKEAAQADLVQQ